MVAEQEMSCLAQEFEALYLLKSDIRDSHHEQTRSARCRFHQNAKSPTETFSDLSNPFTEQSEDMFSLYTNVIANVSVVQTVNELVKICMQHMRRRDSSNAKRRYLIQYRKSRSLYFVPQ